MREASRFRAKVSADGALRVEDQARWAEVLRHLSGRDVEVVIGRHVKRRSLSANAYLFGVVYAYAADWSGNSVAEIHEAFKGLYCPETEVAIPGRTVMVRSTALLPSEAFSAYVENVVADLARAGVYIPAAGQVE